MEEAAMPDALRFETIADMPVQLPQAPASAAASRARFFNSGNAFNRQLPPVPDHVFLDEPVRALDRTAATGFVDCDLSRALDCAGPATTPLVLARYLRIRAGESCASRFDATGSIWYVIAGAGVSECGADRIAWRDGDVFVLPGGAAHDHRAGTEGAVLWVVTNEPQIALENLRLPAGIAPPTDAVHYPAAEIKKQLELIHTVANGDNSAGYALMFSSERHEESRNVLPSFTLALNSLPPGEFQPPHKHNSAAIALVIQGKGCYSLVDGRRKDWAQFATTVTPPTAIHSHHNDGSERALFLIVQDGGLYCHARTMGFAAA
jgi:gentisate 1,2-dioxygenase